MGKIYNNLISTTAGFNYHAKQPLDDREVVQSYSDLAVLVNTNAAYDGMEVYVVDDKKSYKLVDSVWTAMATEEYIVESLSNKVDKVKGKGLSTNDFTDEEKQKLANLTEGSGSGEGVTQVQSDWEQDDSTQVDYIKNKPTVLTETDVQRIIAETGVGDGEVIISVQANWEQTDSTKSDYIKNKPQNLATTEYVDSKMSSTSLPSVTTSDNGKFLRVVDGVWAAATVPMAEDTSV